MRRELTAVAKDYDNFVEQWRAPDLGNAASQLCDGALPRFFGFRYGLGLRV